MRKKLLRVIGVTVLILILCSCGSSDGEVLFEEENYVGSINSDIYHYPECKWANKIKEYNEVWFSSIEDAENEGYRSCHTCNP